MTNDQQVYRKHNSFVGFRAHEAKAAGTTLAKIAVALEEPSNTVQLSTYFQTVLESVKADLFATGSLDRPRFGTKGCKWPLSSSLRARSGLHIL